MRKIREVVIDLLKRYTVAWSGITVLLYAVAIPLTIWIFPATTLLLTIYVLFGGLTSSMAALGSALLTAEEAKDPKA